MRYQLRLKMDATTRVQYTPIIWASSPPKHRPHTKSDSLSSLLGTSEFTKDFEGVGGWRDPGDAKEEALWMGMNSRLELPADVSPRRHRRSLTGGAIPNQRWSWSPIQSRARTPVRMSLEEGRDYFPTNPAATMRPLAHAFELGK
jgi:hypothetical protein